MHGFKFRSSALLYLNFAQHLAVVVCLVTFATDFFEVLKFFYRFMAVSFTALSALVSWPFAAILGLPVVLEMLIIRPRELAVNFLHYALMSGTALIAALIFVDSYYFGRTVLVSSFFLFAHSFGLNVFDGDAFKKKFTCYCIMVLRPSACFLTLTRFKPNLKDWFPNISRVAISISVAAQRTVFTGLIS